MRPEPRVRQSGGQHPLDGGGASARNGGGGAGAALSSRGAPQLRSRRQRGTAIRGGGAEAGGSGGVFGGDDDDDFVDTGCAVGMGCEVVREPAVGDIDSMVEYTGCGSYQVLNFILLSIPFLCDGAEILVISLITAELEVQWQLTQLQVGLLGSTVFAGLLVGAVFAGLCADRLGRKPTLVGTIAVVTAGGVASSFSQDFEQLCALRLLTGVGVGGMVPTMITLVMETTPMMWRGKTTTIFFAMFAVGEMYAAAVNMTQDASDADSWRTLLLWSAAPGGLALMVVPCLIKESPRFLAAQGPEREEELFDTLTRMHRWNKPRVQGSSARANAAAASAADSGGGRKTAKRVRGVDLSLRPPLTRFVR